MKKAHTGRSLLGLNGVDISSIAPVLLSKLAWWEI
jgi:hypothetical protein